MTTEKIIKTWTVESSNGKFTVEAQNKAAATSKAKAFCTKHKAQFFSVVEKLNMSRVAIWSSTGNHKWFLQLVRVNKHVTEVTPEEVSHAIADAFDEEPGVFKVVKSISNNYGLIVVEQHSETKEVNISISGLMIEEMAAPMSPDESDVLTQIIIKFPEIAKFMAPQQTKA